MLAFVSLPESFSTLAFAAGLAGMICTAFLAPRRWALSSLALWLGFTTLVAAGVLGVGKETPVPAELADKDAYWSGVLALAGMVTLAAGGIACVLDLRARERQIRLAGADGETLRRDIDRLNGINVRLEDEIQDLRRKARSGEDQRSGPGAVLEATLARHRKAVDTATQQARKHRAVFDGAVEGMALLERETLRLVDVNPGLARISGYDAKELGEKTLLDLFSTTSSAPGKSDLQRSARERRAMTVVLARKDGQETPAELTIGVVGDADDAQLLVVVRDTTDRTTVEQDHEAHVRALRDRVRALEDENAAVDGRYRSLEQANRRLMDMSERKDHFLASVSHELRTPLTSIRSFSEILLKHDDSEPEVHREFLEIIHKESERLTRMVNNVLDLARIEAGAAKLAVSEFDARSVVEDAVASMQGMAADHHVRVRAVPGAVEQTLRADRDRVQQLLINLVSNAVKFSPEDTDVEVCVEPADGTGRVRLSVVDHGRGIPETDLERVFDRFERIEDESGAAGAGLGLSICREIMTMHGGKLWVESDVGSGSRFHAEFPGVEQMRMRLGSVAGGHSAEDVLPPLGEREPPPPAAPNRPNRDDWSTTGTLPPLGLR